MLKLLDPSGNPVLEGDFALEGGRLLREKDDDWVRVAEWDADAPGWRVDSLHPPRPDHPALEGDGPIIACFQYEDGTSDEIEADRFSFRNEDGTLFLTGVALTLSRLSSSGEWEPPAGSKGCQSVSFYAVYDIEQLAAVRFEPEQRSRPSLLAERA